MLRLLLALLLVAGCAAAGDGPDAPPPSDAAFDPVAAGPVLTGAHALAREGVAALPGRRVGLIVNHTARADSAHLIDLVAALPGVEIAALFGPEHGIRGEADAGEKVASGVDHVTGAPIFSLYGDTRKPTAEMLEDVDVLVFDIQDVGARFYTYISTMGLAMQAAAAEGIPFVVLDRPNPIGGSYVSGYLLEDEHSSFVGLYPIPIAHGMTVGELAEMIVGERLIDGVDGLDLRVVPADGWERSMLWPETGLPWIAPSPNIPDFETALVYPGTCFFEATSASEGRGTRSPFRIVGAPWADGAALADTLNARGLPGVRFEATSFTPESIPGMASQPKLEGEALEGVRLVVTDAGAYRAVETGVHVLHAFYHAAPDADAFLSRPEWLAKLAGSEALGEALRAGARPEAIVAAWEAETEAFRALRQPYLRYE